jgi:hypothetical protein
MASIEQARAALAPHGALAPQSAADHWRGEIPLPEPIASFYEQVGPLGEWINQRVGHAGLTVPAQGNAFSIPPLSRLWQLQAGYRWHGITGERIAAWPGHWLVVADQGADPFIFDLRTGAVHFAMHGAGEWQADELFADIVEMAACLGTIGQVWDEAGDAIFTDDDDCEVDPVHRARLVARLAPLVGAARAEGLADTFGW